MLQFAGQNNAGNIGQMYPLTTTQGTNQYTNTTQASSSNPWLQGLNLIPGDIASTAANLAKSLGSIPGYTPGGAPLAGGSSLIIILMDRQV